MKQIKQVFILALVAVFTTLTGCNSSHNDEPMPDVFVTFATLESINENSCVFSAQQSENSAPVEFIATVSLSPEQFSVGNRYVIQYSTLDNQPYTPGIITLYVILNAFNGEAVVAPMTEIQPLTTQPVNVLYAGRTGNYINFQATASISVQPKTFNIYVDETTLDSEYPTAYLAFVSDNPGGINDKSFYASFNVGSVINQPGVKGIKLHCRVNGAQTILTFENGKESFTEN